MDYLKLLNYSFQTERSFREYPISRLEYLADYIFDCLTEDGEVSELFARKAIEVENSITSKTTFNYIQNPDDYRWFLIMCNFPFFSSRIDYGTSVRGAWWKDGITLQSCGLWEGEDQLTELKFSDKEWKEFMMAVSEFSEERV